MSINTEDISKKNNGKNDNLELVTTQNSSYPTLVAQGGFDSTLEELYTFAAAPALERGYNCLTFEGPGQGNVILKQGIAFRHDWEKMVTPLLDFMLSKKTFNIDSKRIALMGISMGRYLAGRTALLLSHAYRQLFFMMVFTTDMMPSKQDFPPTTRCIKRRQLRICKQNYN